MATETMSTEQAVGIFTRFQKELDKLHFTDHTFIVNLLGETARRRHAIELEEMKKNSEKLNGVIDKAPHLV